MVAGLYVVRMCVVVICFIAVCVLCGRGVVANHRGGYVLSSRADIVTHYSQHNSG